MPRRLVLEALERAGPFAGLYLHPHELDPEPLRVLAPSGTPLPVRVRGVLRSAQRNSARRVAPATLRAIAERFAVIPYGEAYAQLSGGAATGS
jgi:hypothetical protein